MIIVGDVHSKNKEPYRSAINNFFEWLIENYKNEIVVLLGDLFDSSSPHAEVEEEIARYLVQLKKVVILKGNHDESKKSGNTLLPLNAHANITVFSEQAEIEIEGYKCLILPYTYDKRYEEIEWSGDFCFLHMTDLKNQFGEEGIDLSKIKATKIWGHTHTPMKYDDNVIIGVPVKTRNLEKDNSIIKIDGDKNIQYIEHPSYFDFEKIKYGNFPENKNNILNIYDAPSMQAVRETYKDYYIRDEGVEILRSKDTSVFSISAKDTKIDKDNMSKLFNTFNKEELNLSKEVNQCCSTLLQKIN